MQMQTGIRALNERLDNSRSWMAEQEALRDEWSASGPPQMGAVLVWKI